MFEGRIRWILAALAGLYFVFLCRVLYLQTAEADLARESVARRLTGEVPLPPRRGTIRDATGLVLARDEVGYDLLADAWGLGAVEWECEECGRVVRSWESDPGEGPADVAPRPAPRPGPCREHAGRWVPTYAADRAALADLLGEAPEAFSRDLEAVRREGWTAARETASGRDARWRRLILRDRLTRSRPVRRGIGRGAAMEVLLHPERYPGLRVEARAARAVDPHLDGATRRILGRTGPVLEDDLRERGKEFEAEGLTGARLAEIQIGRSGIERSFDRRLRGTFGRERRGRDVYGRTVSREAMEPVTDGEDLRLTLDAPLNGVAEGLLGGRRGGLVAIDPRTGAVLALAGAGGVEPGDPLPAVTGLEPGSVLKVLTAAVAREGGLAPEAGEVRCLGRKSRPVSCEHEHGSPGLREALGHSCNAYFGEAALRIGVRPLQDYARRLGIDRPYGIGIPLEGGGTAWTQEQFRRPWRREDLTNLGIGQGPVLLSPLQVAALYAAVANGGRPVRPFLVQGSGTPSGDPVLAPETLVAIRAGLEETVRSGTAAEAGLGSARAAGKTGTAQLGRGKGCNAWFAGYAPAEDPRIVVVVVLPDQEESGGRAAAPIVAAFLDAWRAREESR